MPATLACAGYRLALDRPRLMGVVNLSADSFSGDGCAGDASRAVERGLQLVEEGADILDLGAESSRPGAMPVSAEEELNRLLPVLEGLRGCGVPISVDTTKPQVMRAASRAGASMINDIRALEEPGAMEAAASSTVALCLMHMQGQPATMQLQPRYDDVVQQVFDYLSRRVAAAMAAGVARERLLVDPGFGFGKTLAHNLSLLRHLDRFAALGVPLLVGLSRKSMLGAITGQPVGERLAASVAAAMLAAQRGAAILRVHDVAATRDALAVWHALESGAEAVSEREAR